MRETMPSSHHQRQHLGAARDAIAEIAAIGDEMDLRHRHRDAAGKARGDQENQQKPRRYADVGARGLGRGLRLLVDRGGGPPAHRQSERQDSGGDDDSYAGIGHAPADQRNREAHQKRPDRSGEVIAGGDNDDRDARAA